MAETAVWSAGAGPGPPRPTTSGGRSADLEISRAWLVDPARGPRGPRRARRRGRHRAQRRLARWRRGRGCRRIGRGRRAGLRRSPCPLPGAGLRGRRDRRDRVGGRRPWRVHDRLPHAQHGAADRRGERPRPRSRGGRPVGIARRGPRLRRRERRAGWRDARRPRRAGRRRRDRVQRRRRRPSARRRSCATRWSTRGCSAGWSSTIPRSRR